MSRSNGRGAALAFAVATSLALALAAFAGCNREARVEPPKDATRAAASVTKEPASPASSPAVIAAGPGASSVVPAVSASATPPGDAAAPALSADGDAGSATPLAGKTVLHYGDSMVGGVGGLTKAIEPLFKAEGARFVRDHEVSASVITVAQQPRLKELLQRHKPDLVILTLGANDVFVPFPDSMASSVEAIVKRIAPRACWWIGPPTWKPDTGIVRVIREHAGACHFFDSSNMKLERRGDGIHPTDKGGVVWGDRFWEAYKAGGQISPLVVDGGG